ncbi:MAG: aldehyde dehydrogenase family protein [Hyphomonas sp.]|uniref:L-piperidine-6-carboxylate dehydrogenase n=1 Tax=Hyphomonas sp. TaxID=87 RepID=UPI0035299955
MTQTLSDTARALLGELGIPATALGGGDLPVCTPLTGEVIAQVHTSSAADVDRTLQEASDAFRAWRSVPAPRRGELVRLFGEELRTSKSALAGLVTLEAGKIPSEGEGEVQEMIDICDFAVGLSRQLHGLTIMSERPGHRMMETWHPAGVVGVISAFNFPVAVWSWNAALALVCGDPVVWKPSEKTPLTALATMAIFRRALARFGDAPDGLAACLIGGADVGEALARDPRVAVASATGSTRMGRAVGPVVAARFGKSILELGGNNAAIVCPSADLDLAVRAIAFSAMGTAGQRCTTLRRLFVHESLWDTLMPRLEAVWQSVKVGNPLDGAVLVGPLIDCRAHEAMEAAIHEAGTLAAEVIGGERVDTGAPDAFYVRPAIVKMPAQEGPMLRETFAPILYALRYTTLEEAIALNNAASAGLSSSIFTTDLREAETFLSATGSDCGIANVNIGTSGAEIGGAFGGEKETGGGRESGSDAWKAYMRRATNTVNYSRDLPLAQGVSFDL